MQAILDSILDGIIVIDRRATIVSLNPVGLKMFGYEADELTGRNINLLMPEPSRGLHDGYLANYIPTGKTKVIGAQRKLEGQTKTGGLFPMELTITSTSVSE